MFFIRPKPLLNPFIALQSLVLGIESITTPVPTKSYLKYPVSSPISTVIPLVTTSSTVKKEANKKSSSKKTTLPTHTPLPIENTLVHLLHNKQNTISTYVYTKNSGAEETSVLTSNIFESQLVETFGVSLANVFSGFLSIQFTNSQIISPTEAISIAIVQTKTDYKTYKCFFVYKTNDWFLYKTEDL